MWYQVTVCSGLEKPEHGPPCVDWLEKAVEDSVLLNNLVRSGGLVQHEKGDDPPRLFLCTDRGVAGSVTTPGWFHDRCAG